MSFFTNLTNSGIEYANRKSEAQITSIVNYVSIILTGSILLLLIVRYLLFAMAPTLPVITLGIATLFPLWLNKKGYLFSARLYLCWLPTIGIMGNYVYLLKVQSVNYTSLYDSLYIYLLGCACIPYLINTIHNKRQFLLSLSLPAFTLFFTGTISDFFEVSPQYVGNVDIEFPKNAMRVKIAYILLSASCFVIKYKLDEGEKLNEQLIDELADKNKVIQERAEKDLLDANTKLNSANIELESSQSKLLENERRLSNVFAATSDAFWEWNPEKNIYFYSSRWFEMLGYENQSFIMNPDIYRSICHPDDYKQVLKAIDEVSTNPGTKGIFIEFRVKHKKGHWCWILMRGNVVSKGEDNRAIIISGTNTDISSRKLAEEEIKQSEAKYRSIFENIQDIFFQTDMNGTILEVSPSVERYLKQKRNEIIGTSIYNFYFNPSDREKLLDRLVQVGELRDYELKLKTAEHTYRFASLNIRLIGDQDGNPYKIEGMLRDITERKRKQQIEDKLKEASRRLSLATTSAKIGIWEWHIETGKLIWDEQMNLLFEVSKEYKHVDEWKHHILPEDGEKHIEKVRQTLQTGKGLHSDFRIITRNGKIKHVETTAWLYRNNDEPTRLIGACWDITDRKRIEEALVQNKANLDATINNTNFLVWSLDKNLKLINLNKPFIKFLEETYNIQCKEGQLVHDYENRSPEFSPEWLTYYYKALNGESFTIKEERGKRNFKFSINPIRENNQISGCTVFGEEITELIAKEHALRLADKQISELKIMALRSAMNPHFIFNTLNSIQYYILKNEPVNAVNYLSTFSTLIRSILNNSISHKIRLSDELEQLKLYIQLELLRFENKFDFTFEVEEELDVENKEISSLLIQPYVENAIIHGLCNKKEQGMLKIFVKEDNDAILFEIEDNGIGRKESSKNKLPNDKGHRSLGTKLTEERLQLMNSANNMSLQIEDLYEAGIATGTRVKIWVR